MGEQTKESKQARKMRQRVEMSPWHCDRYDIEILDTTNNNVVKLTFDMPREMILGFMLMSWMFPVFKVDYRRNGKIDSKSVVSNYVGKLTKFKRLTKYAEDPTSDNVLKKMEDWTGFLNTLGIVDADGEAIDIDVHTVSPSSCILFGIRSEEKSEYQAMLVKFDTPAFLNGAKLFCHTIDEEGESLYLNCVLWPHRYYNIIYEFYGFEHDPTMVYIVNECSSSCKYRGGYETAYGQIEYSTWKKLVATLDKHKDALSEVEEDHSNGGHGCVLYIDLYKMAKDAIVLHEPPENISYNERFLKALESAI